MGADQTELALPDAERVTLNGRDAEIIFRPERISAERMIAQLAAAASITDLTVEAPDIEELVARMYKEMKL